MGSTLSLWLTRHRNRLAAISLVVVALAMAGVRDLGFETGYRIFFNDDNPYLQAHDLIEDTYTHSDTISFLVTSRDGDLFTREHLHALEVMTEESWRFPFSLRVDSLTNFQYTHADDNGLVVENLFEDSLSMSDATLATRRDIALADPLLRNNLVNPDGNVTLVNITLQFDDGDKDAGVRDRELVELARQMRDDFEARFPTLDILVFGQLTINNTFNEMTEQDIRTLSPVMSLILFVTLWLLFSLAGLSRGAAMLASASVMLVITLSVGVTLGMAGWLGMPLNAANAIAPTIILTIAVADCVHVLFSYLNGLRAGLTRDNALRDSLAINLQPVFLTSLTTAVGFLALNFSDTPPMRSLGSLTAIGIVAAWLLTLGLLPALALWLPLTPRHGDQGRSHLMARFADHVMAHQRRYFWGIGGLTVLALFGIPRNTLNDSTLTYFDETVPFYVAAHYYEDHLSGFDLISYSLDSGTADGINDPAFLERVDAFVQWVTQHPEVAHVSSYTHVIKRLNRNLHGDDPDWYRIPDTRELAGQYLLLYELSLPFGLDLNSMINTDKSALRVDIRVRKQKPHEVIALASRFSEWLDREAPQIRATPGASVSIMFAHMGSRNIDSMFTGNLVALTLITLILVIAMRSLRYGLISLLPNALPALITIGLWGFFKAEVNLAVAVIFVVTLGIVVDDTVHFLSKYLRARRQHGLAAEDAVRYAFAHVGNALVITSVVLAAGFMVLAQSHFQINAVMGMLVAITIAVALLFDFFFLPALLLRLDRTAQQQR